MPDPYSTKPTVDMWQERDEAFYYVKSLKMWEHWLLPQDLVYLERYRVLEGARDENRIQIYNRHSSGDGIGERN